MLTTRAQLVSELDRLANGLNLGEPRAELETRLLLAQLAGRANCEMLTDVIHTLRRGFSTTGENCRPHDGQKGEEMTLDIDQLLYDVADRYEDIDPEFAPWAIEWLGVDLPAVWPRLAHETKSLLVSAGVTPPKMHAAVDLLGSGAYLVLKGLMYSRPQAETMLYDWAEHVLDFLDADRKVLAPTG